MSKAHGKEYVQNNFSTKKENIIRANVEKTEEIAPEVDNIVKNGNNAKAKMSRSPATGRKKKSSKSTLRESNNTDEAKRVAVVHPITPPLSPDGKEGVDDVMAVIQVLRDAIMETDTKATWKSQEMNCDEESIEMRGEEEKKEEGAEENKENVRPKRSKKDNVRLSG